MSAPVQTNIATQEQATGIDDSHIQQGVMGTGMDQEQVYRAGGYSLLAALLRSIPGQAIIDHIKTLSEFPEQGDDLSISLHMLGLAAKSCNQVTIDDEYHNLFIGLGRGELVPYGSWYLTGFLMEKPLGHLRRDLSTLGFERSPEMHEPEDHVAALCEVMSLLIDEDREHDEQRQFFETHMGTWMGQFFTDLSQAKSAVFYRAVGRFGYAFIEFEQQYMSMKV